MRIVFAGTPANAALTLSALVASGMDVVGVITREDAPIGRKKILTPSAVAQVANQLGLPVIKANSITEAVLQSMAGFKAELGVVVAYGAFLNQNALSSLAKGWINLHYSLLPKYRGAAPVQHAILNGDAVTGVSVFQLDQGMDTGEVLLQVPTKIEPQEDTGRLLDRLTELGISALKEILPTIAAGVTKPWEQDNSQATFAPKISREQALIDWSVSAVAIENLIKAMNPEPMAWTMLAGEPFRIIAATAQLAAESSRSSRSPGTVRVSGKDVLVDCLGSTLRLDLVQPSGKQPMQASDWIRGQQQKESIAFGS